MGERYKNFLHAFDGISLNWNAVFGSGFSKAPKHWVTVYRECSLDELIRIARTGLSAPPIDARHPGARQEMEVLDSFRPEQVTARGISRAGAIYAVPTTETPKLPFRRERIVIEMKVDPAVSFVGDMDFITCLIPFIDAYRYGLEKYQGAFKKYWESVIPLGEFNRHYRKVETMQGTHWVAKTRAPRGLPRSFFAPEIMVMAPLISQQHIRICGQVAPGENHEEGHSLSAHLVSEEYREE